MSKKDPQEDSKNLIFSVRVIAGGSFDKSQIASRAKEVTSLNPVKILATPPLDTRGTASEHCYCEKKSAPLVTNSCRKLKNAGVSVSRRETTLKQD